MYAVFWWVLPLIFLWFSIRYPLEFWVYQEHKPGPTEGKGSLHILARLSGDMYYQAMQLHFLFDRRPVISSEYKIFTL